MKIGRVPSPSRMKNEGFLEKMVRSRDRLIEANVWGETPSENMAFRALNVSESDAIESPAL